MKKTTCDFTICMSVVLITDYAVTNFAAASSDFESIADDSCVNLYLFTNQNVIRNYFPKYWKSLDSTNTSSNNSNAAFCDPFPNGKFSQ